MADERAQQTGGFLEARRFVRFPVSLPVIGRAREPRSNQEEIEGVMRSVGAGGLMAEFPIQMSLGSTVELVLQTRHGRLTMDCRVVWASAIKGTVRHGFAFREPNWPGFAMDLFLDENR